MLGLDLIGAVTIPTAGANYTDAKTVCAVQAALVKKGYDLGKSGPNKDGVDGVFGSKTKDAIKKLQKTLGMQDTGKIDEGVIMALQVTPGVLPPGVTMEGRAAVQADAALAAATKAEHQAALSNPDPVVLQETSQELQKVANAAAPPPPPEVQAKVKEATAQAKNAQTPAEKQAAAQSLAAAASAVNEAVKPSWFSMPAWEGGPPRWQVGVGLLGLAGAGTLGYVVLKK